MPEDAVGGQFYEVLDDGEGNLSLGLVGVDGDAALFTSANAYTLPHGTTGAAYNPGSGLPPHA
jgi:hypothetical protein